MNTILLVLAIIAIVLLVVFIKVTVWIWSLIFKGISYVFDSIFTNRTMFVLTVLIILILI